MRTAGHIIVTTLGLTIGIALQAVMVCALLNLLPSKIPIIIPALCHIAGSFFAATVYFQLKTVSRYVFFYLSFISGLIMPTAGILFTGAIFVYRTICNTQRQSAQDWDVALEENEVTDTLLTKNGDEKDFLLSTLDLESFADILNGTDLNLKRSVIEKLSEDDKKDNIRLLRKALKDQDPEIRFYASAGLKKIEENFQKYLMAIQKKLQSNPDSFENNLLLGNEYFRFARSGMLDRTTTNFYYEQSRKSLEKAVCLERDNEQSLLSLGKVYLQLEDYDAALDCLDKAHTCNPENWQILIWRCEVHYSARKYERIKNDCAQISNLNTPWDSVRDITQYWTAHA